jgi:hypothetical protein
MCFTEEIDIFDGVPRMLAGVYRHTGMAVVKLL